MFFSFKVKKTDLWPNDDFTTYLPPTQALPSKKNATWTKWFLKLNELEAQADATLDRVDQAYRYAIYTGPGTPYTQDRRHRIVDQALGWGGEQVCAHHGSRYSRLQRPQVFLALLVALRAAAEARD